MMDRQALMTTLKDLLEENQGEAFENLQESTNFREEMGLDSVDLVTLVMQVQDRFRITLESDELEQLQTVADLLNLLQTKQEATAKAA